MIAATVGVRVHEPTGLGACVSFAWTNALLARNPHVRWPGDVHPTQWALTAHQLIAQHCARIVGPRRPINPLHGARIHQAAGLIDSCDKLRTVDEMLAALEVGPVVAGMPWFDAMMHPDADHRARPIGANLGLHCVALTERDGDLVRLRNSHGPSYGHRGDAWISVDDLAGLVPAGCVVDFS